MFMVFSVSPGGWLPFKILPTHHLDYVSYIIRYYGVQPNSVTVRAAANQLRQDKHQDIR
jgi:hypothetical protein